MIYCSTMLTIALALTHTQGHAGSMGSAAISAPGSLYAGVFGGTSRSNHINMSQYGTAFYTEAQGGPLAVNAFGQTNSRTAGLVGGHIGYQGAQIFFPSFNSTWSLVPAIELEGYYLGKSSFTGNDINNDTVRLAEHNFSLTYPMKSGIFLTNAVLNLNPRPGAPCHPYVGIGIGAAVVSISHATATQIDPPEPGINHYNSNNSDTQATFATQAKAGLNIDVTQHASVFIEYRWLYMASSNYTFGSTMYPEHVPTSSWLVKINPQHYNMGAVGIQYRI